MTKGIRKMLSIFGFIEIEKGIVYEIYEYKDIDIKILVKYLWSEYYYIRYDNIGNDEYVENVNECLGYCDGNIEKEFSEMLIKKFTYINRNRKINKILNENK